MQQTHEWGEFFPITISPFGYNETNAMSHFPISREECLKRGWQWRDEDESHEKYLGPVIPIPDTIHEVDETICKKFAA